MLQLQNNDNNWTQPDTFTWEASEWMKEAHLEIKEKIQVNGSMEKVSKHSYIADN